MAAKGPSTSSPSTLPVSHPFTYAAAVSSSIPSHSISPQSTTPSRATRSPPRSSAFNSPSPLPPSRSSGSHPPSPPALSHSPTHNHTSPSSSSPITPSPLVRRHFTYAAAVSSPIPPSHSISPRSTTPLRTTCFQTSPALQCTSVSCLTLSFVWFTSSLSLPSL